MTDTTHKLPHGLGRLQHHDPRSRQFVAAQAPTLVTRLHRHYGPVLDQGDVGACTGYAMAQWLNCKPGHVPRRKYLSNEDALRFYSRATEIDVWPGTYPGQDTGSAGIFVAKAAVEFGWITSYMWPFGVHQTLAAAVLSPVLIGTVWTEAMFDPDEKGFVRAEGEELGGHEYLLVGINVRQKYVTCLNSWGPGWGLKGRFRMTWETLETLLNRGGDATVPVL